MEIGEKNKQKKRKKRKKKKRRKTTTHTQRFTKLDWEEKGKGGNRVVLR